ncbi:MAG: monovalent cation/H+ antiporter complex subunit F [Nitrosospira sp.]|nr:monovalent cation/H+ antiporter complex subunit F [Nitrosospira sp.]
MHTWIFYIVILWQIALIAILALYALRAQTVVTRILALDMLATVFVAALGVIAMRREQVGYLDVALVLAMLGFAQTVGIVRFIEKNREYR